MKTTALVFSNEVCSTSTAMSSRTLLSDNVCVCVCVYIYIYMCVCVCVRERERERERERALTNFTSHNNLYSIKM